MKREIGRILSIVWIIFWSAVALHCLMTSQGKPNLKNPLGPDAILLPDAEMGSVLILGDSHLFKRPLRTFMQYRKADFAIFLGDFVDYDEDLVYHHFLRRLGDPQASIFLVRGNHEAMDFDLNDSDRFLDYVPKTDYTLHHANTLFVILDSSSGRLSEKQLDYADEKMKAFRKEKRRGKIYLLTHYPLTIAEMKTKGLSPKTTDRILAMCKKRRIKAVISGHLHEYKEHRIGRTQVILSGCGGGSYKKPSKELHALAINIEGRKHRIHQWPVKREAKWQAMAEWFLFVTILRYRWIILVVALAFIIREAIHLWRRSKPAPTKKADT